jgi:hypothetical protein
MSGRHWQDYATGTDEHGAYLKASVPQPHGYADLRQCIVADDYRGRTVRLQVGMSLSGPGQVWLANPQLSLANS